MGSIGKSAPAPPDFTKAATPSQYTPFASSTWTHGPSTGGHWEGGSLWGDGPGKPGSHYVEDKGPMEQHVTLTPELQGAAESAMSQLSKLWGTPLDNGAAARQKAEDALYARAKARLDPMFGQREHDLGVTLANQGIDPSSAAYAKALDNEGRTRNDAYSSAINDAITGGGAEASRQLAMDIQSRAAPLAGLQGLQGLTQMPANPLLAAANAQYQGALQGYAAQQAGKNSQLSGLMGLGGTLGAASILGPAAPAAAAASDEAVKTEIVPTGGEIHGVPEYLFEYKDKPGVTYRGVLAQDVERVSPGEVSRDPEGVRHVSERFAPVPVAREPHGS